MFYKSWEVVFSHKVYVTDLIATNEVQFDQERKLSLGSRPSAEIHSTSSEVKNEQKTKLTSGDRTSPEFVLTSLGGRSMPDSEVQTNQKTKLKSGGRSSSEIFNCNAYTSAVFRESRN